MLTPVVESNREVLPSIIPVDNTPPQPSGTETSTPETKVDETPVVETSPKPEVTPDLTETEPSVFKDITTESFKTTEDKPSVSTPEPKKKAVVERDLTFADENDRPLFKQMSNEAFERLSKVYKENREKDAKVVELQKQVKETPVNETLFAHKQGYLLTPEYQILRERVNLTDQIADHWEQQLVRIRNAKQWTGIVIDEKTGELQETEPQPASEEAEAKILRLLHQAGTQQARLVHEHAEFIKQHELKFNQVNEFIDSTITQYFPGYDKPDHPTAKIQQLIEENLHPALKNTPLVKLFKITGAANAALRGENQQLKAEIARLKGIKQDVTEAPPPGSVIKSGGGSTKPAVVTIDDYKREREQ